MDLAFSNSQHDRENWQAFGFVIKGTNKPADRHPEHRGIVGKIFKALVDKVGKHESK